MTTILLTNDDGIHSPGLAALQEALSPLGNCITVAPDRDNSAVSHSLTMKRPLLVKRLRDNVYTVDGTPTDCVALGLKKILAHPPDLLVSGINIGANLGDDISYSGTVSAAMEGTMYSIASMAISIGSEPPLDFRTAIIVAHDIARRILREGLPANTLLNINVPAGNTTGCIRVTRQGRRLWEDSIRETLDPWGGRRYWIGGGTPVAETGYDTDVHAFESGAVSVTPIQLDLTNHDCIARLKEKWRLEKPQPDLFTKNDL